MQAWFTCYSISRHLHKSLTEAYTRSSVPDEIACHYYSQYLAALDVPRSKAEIRILQGPRQRPTSGRGYLKSNKLMGQLQALEPQFSACPERSR